ncbi:ABC transporter permease [uncultured Desulfuromusa sp.]|uniref:ABC transporter permease n=1 Tax=uncultured Desulfuromusa sp. TaxID=219183 RepID=UPI002AA96238|nr:ABC transporter permease [uncultured Desulfuromusa sp.]
MTSKGLFRMRMRGFIRKEIFQIQRDPSSILLALVMPVMLLFLFGYGVSLNPTQIPVALVVADQTPMTRDLAARFELSPYFKTVYVRSPQEAETLMQEGEVAGFVNLQNNLSASLYHGNDSSVQMIVNGIDANHAQLIQGYVAGALQRWSAIRQARGEQGTTSGAVVRSQLRFNEAGESRNYIVPGLIAVIMTLIGTLLTALVIAREWERGTMEAILVTPLRVGELLLGKILPYFGLGMLGMLLSVVGGVWIFNVPFRGSLFLLVLLSAIFLFASMGFGLAISAAVRVQFVAAQIAVIAGFLPAFFLSGLLFDLDSTPAFIQLISHAVAARYFVEISHTLFLAGNIGSVLWPAGLALTLMAILFLGVARRKLSKRLE